MAQNRRPLFRESALKQYMQKREKDTMPRLISPPVFLCSWLLLTLLLCSMLLAWWGQVPVFAVGAGVIQEQSPTLSITNNTSEALLVLPTIYKTQVHTGQSGWIQVGNGGPEFHGTIAHTSAITNPAEAQKFYAQRGIAPLLTQPSLIVTIQLPQIPLQYAGSLVQAHIQVGSRRVLSLFPGFSSFISS